MRAVAARLSCGSRSTSTEGGWAGQGAWAEPTALSSDQIRAGSRVGASEPPVGTPAGQPEPMLDNGAYDNLTLAASWAWPRTRLGRPPGSLACHGPDLGWVWRRSALLAGLLSRLVGRKSALGQVVPVCAARSGPPEPLETLCTSAVSNRPHLTARHDDPPQPRPWAQPPLLASLSGLTAVIRRSPRFSREFTAGHFP